MNNAINMVSDADPYKEKCVTHFMYCWKKK